MYCFKCLEKEAMPIETHQTDITVCEFLKYSPSHTAVVGGVHHGVHDVGTTSFCTSPIYRNKYDRNSHDVSPNPTQQLYHHLTMSDCETKGSTRPPKPPKPMPLPTRKSTTTAQSDNTARSDCTAPPKPSPLLSPASQSTDIDTVSPLLATTDAPQTRDRSATKEKQQQTQHSTPTKQNKFLSPEHWAAKKRDVPLKYSSVELNRRPSLGMGEAEETLEEVELRSPTPGSKVSQDEDQSQAPVPAAEEQPRQANRGQRDMYHNTHFGEEW